MLTMLLLVLLFTAMSTPWAAPAPKAPTGYVDYYPSSGLNVILSGGHGGSQLPSEIPDRDAGCWVGGECVWTHDCGDKDFDKCSATTAKDLHTLELTIELRQALCDRFSGDCPAAVVSNLHRRKLDPNREVNEATFNEPLAVDVYNEFHGYIAAERSAMESASTPGLYIDIHGHGHEIQRAELGYLVSGSALDSGNSIDPTSTSIRSLAAYVGGDFDELLRGVDSFGGILESNNFRAVPSTRDAGPDGDSYFSGGYCTQVYGSRDGGSVDAIQIESPRSFRDLPGRTAYVAALADTIVVYLARNYPAV